MDVTGSRQREELIDWARRIQDIVKQRGEQDVVQTIDAAIRQLGAERFTLAIIGKAKRGKSTLINALLGRKDDVLAPVDRLPTSSAISEFWWSEREEAVVVYQDGHREPVSFDRVREFVTEELNPGNRKKVGAVQISGPFADMDRSLILVDTPGANSIHEHHDVLLRSFIPQADAVIFLVTARMPLDQDELELLKAVKGAAIEKIFFALNRVDELEAQDIRSAVDHSRKILSEIGVCLDQVHQLSAKLAFQGDLEGSGLAELTRDIQSLLTRNRIDVLQSRFVARVRQIISPLQQEISVRVGSSQRSDEELDAELRRLDDAKHTLSSQSSLVQRQFSLAWNTAVDAFERSLPAIGRDIDLRITRRIDETSSIQISRLAKELPDLLTKTFEERLSPESTKLESALRAACRQLEADYPGLELSDGVNFRVRTRQDHASLVASLGGAATAVTGVGLASAGTAAASAIAAANAAAAAATTTIGLSPTLLGLMSSIPYVSQIIPFLAGAGATISTPTAMVTAPLWVALSGPVGWTLTGVGILTIPLAWRVSKLKFKDQVISAVQSQVSQIIDELRNRRIADLRSMGKSLLDEFAFDLERKLSRIESALLDARDRRRIPGELAALQVLEKQLSALIAERSTTSLASVEH